jgi:hypothetical protein
MRLGVVHRLKISNIASAVTVPAAGQRTMIQNLAALLTARASGSLFQRGSTTAANVPIR